MGARGFIARAGSPGLGGRDRNIIMHNATTATVVR